MLRTLLIVAAIAVAVPVDAQSPANYPNGTLVFSNLRTAFGRWLNRVGPMSHSHVGIVIDGQVYEADWPRVKCGPPESHYKRHATYEFYTPTQPYSVHEVAGMRNHARSQLGRPYGVARWLVPGTRFGRGGIYCSEYVRDVLNASGRWRLNGGDGYNPGRLRSATAGGYRYVGAVNR